ncbi:MAG: hypothetical protein JWQ89_3493, partial [Devosia sp.]|uniref:hypothetical protein n=1 Tax=Devosia sp. TaxID=1871048 RepID=UPI002627E041
IMNRRGMPDLETLRFLPFAFKNDVWIIIACDFSFSTGGLQVWNADIRKLYNDPVDPIYPE